MVKTVLFDVDGVLLSEERYFDASALTIWEVLHSDKYVGLDPANFKTEYKEEEMAAIREKVFDRDRVLEFLKSRGLNSNWDMNYITFSYQLIRLLEQVNDEAQDKINRWLTNEIDREVLKEIGSVLAGKELHFDFAALISDFEQSSASGQELFDYLDRLAEEKLHVQTTMFSKIDQLWSVCEHVTQEWYVGDGHIIASTGKPSVQTGKKGFFADEKTLAAPNEIEDLFESLKSSGVTIGLGTGRPHLEVVEPFRHLGWLKHFEMNNIVTADDVLEAEEQLPEGTSLSKPHPYTYVLALSGKRKTAEQCLNEPLPLKNGKEILIVGDSLADLLAARDMGCLFAAVLTGLSGQDARGEMEEHGADYILDGVLDVKDVVMSLVK